LAHLLRAESVRDASGILGTTILLDGTRIAAVGTDVPDAADAHDLGGVVVPGLVDAHFHPVGYAAALQRPSLRTAADFDEVCDRLRDALRDRPAGSSLVALRLDDERLAEGRLPDRHVVDRAAPDHPVLLIRSCGHIAVANSAALEAAGLDPSVADPPGGSFDRDGAGRLTGVLRETAVEGVARTVDSLTPPLDAAQVAASMTAAASVGLTAMGAVVAAGSSMWGAGGSELEVLLGAAASIPIDLRVLVAAGDPGELRRSAERIAATPGRIGFLGVKLFSDGSFGGHTAAMLEPYADRPRERGTDRLDPEWALRMARASLDLGGKVAVHAIGDAANRAVLDLMETLLAGGADPADLRVEHASVLTAADIERFGRIGVTASVQPAFLASEHGWVERRVGPERIRRTYAFRSLLDAGAPLAGGSDCPVEPPDPLVGMAAARDRCGVVPEEALEAGDALRLFTEWSARAIGLEGWPAPGAPATFTVLDRDPVTASADGLRSARVLSTWVDGLPVEVPAGLQVWND
jgi:predicted amidohydrolase YtcJ